MNISIGSLNITSYCLDNLKHNIFRYELMKDDLIYDFVSTSIGDDLLVPVTSDDIELEHSYIIEDNNNPVGYIYLEGISEEEGIVELRYAVNSKYRRLSYGKRILEECSNYLFTFDNINQVELHIRKDNIASIGCSVKAKYKKVGEYDPEYYYIYRKAKYED